MVNIDIKELKKWLGPYGNIRDNAEKFAKECVIKVKKNKKIASQAGTPSKVALWNFIGNPREVMIVVGDYDPPYISYVDTT